MKVQTFLFTSSGISIPLNLKRYDIEIYISSYVLFDKYNTKGVVSSSPSEDSNPTLFLLVIMYLTK